jgi:serine O-acetyltransferase
MLRVLLGDVIAASVWVAGTPACAQGARAQALIAQADAAHRYAKRFGRPHPKWGLGTLQAVALTNTHSSVRPSPALRFDLNDVRILHALSAVLQALAARKLRPQPCLAQIPPHVIKCAKARRIKGALMAETKQKLAAIDPIWDRVRTEAAAMVQTEPLLGGLVHSSLLHHPSLERALAYRFSLKLASGEMSEQILREIADAAYDSDAGLGQCARADLAAVFERDPACTRLIQPMLFFKGYQAVQAYRVGHWLWGQGRRDMAYFVQMRVSEVFGVDIHPAATIGRGIMIDHAHSIVVGETAVVGDNVSMLHSVTLGGTGKEDGDRHPKIGNGVLIGAGAKVLGNITIGHCSRIAAGSVVLMDVPPCMTVAGVPARIVGEAGCDQPSVMMDQLVSGAV